MRRITKDMHDRKYQGFRTSQKEIKSKIDNLDKVDNELAPPVGLEPTTYWLIATRSIPYKLF